MTIIAIDGPAGAGKSTIAAAVAQRLGYEVLDTGAMYRSITWAVLRSGVDPTDAGGCGRVARSVDVRLVGSSAFVDGEDVSTEIRSPEVSDRVSDVSVHPEVRDVLVDLQRRWMAERPGGVVEGRDIGTVVFPDAEVKIFLTADPSVRAARRAGDGPFDAAAAADNIARRDELDSGRAASPLVRADDAVLVDSTDLDVDGVVDRILAEVQR